MRDEYRLTRFIEAQEAIYEQALAEIRQGRKSSHWTRWVFPQIAGFGFSPTSRHYSIGSVAEARAYLAHPVLGDRYRDCINALQELGPTNSETVFGSVDAQKLRSSLTLFASAAPEEPLFRQALDRWFGGVPDERTLATLASAPAASEDMDRRM